MDKSSESSAAERRGFPRVPGKLMSNIRYSVPGDTSLDVIEAALQNISLNGVFFECDYELPRGTILNFNFNLPDSRESVFVRGIVAWVRQDRQITGIGVKFLRVSARDKERIMSYIENQQEKTAVRRMSRFSSPVEMLTQTDNHRQFIRFYFREIGSELAIEAAKAMLSIPDSYLDGIFKDFQALGLISIYDDNIKFFFAKEQPLRSAIEEWIRTNGII